MRRWILSLAAVPMLFCVAAHADQIDGDWCSTSGEHLKITDSAITIPSGAEITGTYLRHSFTYVGPQGDPEAGHSISMRQLSDDDMLLQRTIDGVAGEIENWRRCQAVS